VDDETRVPSIEVVLRIQGSDELVLVVFETDTERMDVVVGCADVLLYENFMAILTEVVTASQHVTGWQHVHLPSSYSLPFTTQAGIDR